MVVRTVLQQQYFEISKSNVLDQKLNPILIITYRNHFPRFFHPHFHLLGKQYSDSRLSSIISSCFLFLPFVINKRWYKEVHFVNLGSPYPSTFLLQARGYCYPTICARVGCSINPLKKYNQFKINFTRLCWDTFDLLSPADDIRLDKLPWATFNTSNSSLVMAVFYFPLSLALFVASFYEARTSIRDCSRGRNKAALYLLHSGFLSFSSLKRRFDSGYWFSWKYKIFDNCSRFVLINDFSEKCWFWCFEFRCRGDFRRNSGIFEIWFYDENLILLILTIWFWVYWWSDFRNFFIIFFFQFLQFKGIIIIWF